jgi:hypothetical protein
MWSFSFSDVAPVAGLGIFASASIVLGLTALTIVKATVIIGRTTPEMRLNIKAKIKITMSSIFWIKLRVNPLLKDLLFNGDKTFTSIIIDTQTYSSFDENGKKIVINEADEFAAKHQG